MLFNSGLFLQFFAAFLLLYYLVAGRLAWRNALIVIASYVFYGAWDVRFLALLVFSSVLDYGVGLGLEAIQTERGRRRLLAVSIVANLGILGFFKYYDFFAKSFAALLARFDLTASPLVLNVVLPVGISFYTFQSMSYTIDVYRRDLPACRNLIHFLAYVSFFPQLVAGPIERATHLLPQFAQTLTITGTMVREGLWLAIWGMFKKVVIADRMAPLVEMVYGHPDAGGPAVLLATAAFAVQIYCDFSGYSDIARGTAKMLGFELMVNFNLPYLAANIREFWQRWHISLSTWLRDYLYIPLGGNRHGAARTAVNLLLTMLLGGLWHGANWTFVLWGVWHGVGLIGQRYAPMRFGRVFGWCITVCFVLYGWLLFRAESLEQVIALTRELGDAHLPPWFGSYVLNLAIFITPLALMELWQARARDLLAPMRLGVWSLALLEAVLVAGILLFWDHERVPFIYFQF